MSLAWCKAKATRFVGTRLRLLSEGSMWLVSLMGPLRAGRMRCSRWASKQQQAWVMQGYIQTLALLDTWHAELRDRWFLIVRYVVLANKEKCAGSFLAVIVSFLSKTL